MAILSVKSVILGDPASPRHQIDPIQLSELLEQIQDGATTGGNFFFEDTLANLNAVASPAEGDTGFVLDDGANTGTYRYESAAWVLTAALPPSFAAAGAAEASGFAILRQSYLPGDTPQNFTQTLTGPTAATLDALASIVEDVSEGAIFRVVGAKIVGVRERIKITADRRYQVQWRVRRHLNPTDPAGDTVRLGIAWLNGLKNLVEYETIEDKVLAEADGIYGVTRFIVAQEVTTSDITPPAGAVYAVPYVQTFGADGQTDILELDFDTIARVANTFYVTKDGNDLASGASLSDPLASVKEALARAEANGTSTVVIVQPGDYLVPPDTVIPANCALYGYDLRVTKLTLSNAEGTAAAIGAERENNMFQLTSGCKVRGFTFTNLKHNVYDAITEPNGLRFDPANELFNVPSKGWAFVFKPGELITRSPYISDCSMLHNFTQQEMVLPINRLAGNPDMPIGGGNLLADGSVLDPDSPLRSVVVDSFTSINPNGVGYAIIRNAFVQLVSVFTNWSRVGLWSHEGGQVTVANSNSTFGDYALAATGLRYAVLIPDPTSNISEQDAAAGIIDTNFEAIVTSAMARYQSLPGWNASYDELAERDTRTLLRAIANDLRSGQSRATQYFTKGLFDWNANFAFNQSLVPLFILSWQEVEVVLYDRIVSIPARNMITTLIDMAQAVAQDIYNRLVAATPLIESPYVTAYNSVVEATGQQFSYAGSGVNYNSLPFSQRGTGTAPDPSSAIVKSGGGRIYATFSTEVGDTYLGEDLRVDFERSTIEGQAFSRGVQNITLPLTIALGG